MPNRRNVIKAAATVALGSLATPLFAIHHRFPMTEEVIGHGTFRYRVHRDWARINPYRHQLVNCHEMVRDAAGRFIMIGDGPEENIIVFDADGKVIDAWGTIYPGGHGLTLHAAGEEEHLYICESGWVPNVKSGLGNQVVRQNGYVTKATLDGRLLLMIGHPSTVGAYAPDMMFQPTETAVAPNGDIYVADGYGSDYILQYNYQGEFIRKFGGSGNADPNYDLANAHGVAVDLRDPDHPKLLVTSRAQRAFKYFTLDGRWLKTVNLANLQPCRPVIHGSNVYAGVCWSHDFGKSTAAKPWLEQTGFTLVMDENDRVVSCPGGKEPVYRDGKLQAVQQNEARTFYHGHDVCVDPDENLIVCQWNGNRTPPIKLERI